jgi:alpha-beta hydrolase superfamily lysophospholipase
MGLDSRKGEMRPSATFEFISTDGLRVACFRWNSRRAARGVVQIAHGMGEHVGRYTGTIDVLVANGLTIYSNDHRGHGRTAPSPAQFGDFGPGGFDLLVDDLARLSRIAKEENPGLPLILLGHGMGSFAAQQYALDHSRDIDGLALSGSGALDGLARLARPSSAKTNILNDPFEPAQTPFDWLSRDDATVAAFMSDPLCFAELKPAAFASFLGAAPRLQDQKNLAKIRKDLPIYLFSGSDDPVGQQLEGVQALIERYREAGIREIAHDFYPDGRHEMLNELNRDEVRARLLRWLLAVVEKASPRTSASQTEHEISPQ